MCNKRIEQYIITCMHHGIYEFYKLEGLKAITHGCNKDATNWNCMIIKFKDSMGPTCNRFRLPLPQYIYPCNSQCMTALQRN